MSFWRLLVLSSFWYYEIKEKISIKTSKIFIIIALLFVIVILSASNSTYAYNDGLTYGEAGPYQSIYNYKSVSDHNKSSYKTEQYSGFFNGGLHGYDRYKIYDRYENLAPFVQQRLTSPAIVSTNFYEVTESFTVGYSATLSIGGSAEVAFKKVLKASVNVSYSQTSSQSNSTSVKYQIQTIPGVKQFLGIVVDGRIQRLVIEHGRYYVVWASTWSEDGYVVTPWSSSDSWWAIQPIFVDRQQYFDFNDPSALNYLNSNLK